MAEPTTRSDPFPGFDATDVAAGQPIPPEQTPMDDAASGPHARDPNGPVDADAPPTPGDGDRNTDIHPPEGEGGQPAVGDDLPRSTEF